jgi:monoamine oxidase
MDDTKPDGSFPCIMAFIQADKAVELAALSPDERKSALANHYTDLFRCPEMKHPINYVEKNWMADEFSGGCYVSTFPPGTLTSFGPEMRKPFLKTYFAGTETATRWAGYMDGAVEAGERAAREVLHAMGKIGADQIWAEEAPDESFPEVPFEKMFIERILPSLSTFMKIAVPITVALVGCLLYRL